MIPILTSLTLLAAATTLVHFSLPPRATPFDWLPPLPETAETAFLSPKGSVCRETYERFFDKQTVDIRIVMGYKDTRPARFVGDRYEATALVDHLSRPCPPRFHACGFRRADDDETLLTKEVPGPDRRPRRIRLQVVHSSAGPDDQENREDPFQKWQSEQAKKTFLEGIGGADMVLYNGHSRDGGGPDFGPPRLTADGHVFYWWYQTTRPGLREMITALEKGKGEGTKLMGLFSCVSSRHFSNALLTADPELGLVTSESLIYYTDSLKNLLGTISSVLGMWCRESFEVTIQAESAERGSRLSGFFKDQK